MKKLVCFIFTFHFSLFTFHCGAQYKVLWNFNFDTGASYIGKANGSLPHGSLTILRNKLYGMTYLGGSHGAGNIFSIDTNGSGYKDMFDCIKIGPTPYGNGPYGDLILIGKNLFGVMGNDGRNLGGTIISIDTNGSGIRDLVDFPGADNVTLVEANLAYSHGKFYGMSVYGGANQTSNIFSINTNGGGFIELYDFSPVLSGLNQINSLIISGNKLFGISCYGGGGNDLGNVFTLDTNGNNYKDLHDFNGTDGEYPQGSYLIISGNKLFGITYQGGAYNDGCIFSLDTTGNNYKDLLDFDGTNGDSSCCSLIISGSKLYGMTTFGGAHGYGCIFSIDTDGTGYTNLHNFNLSSMDGAQPYGSLTLSGGVLYGMTSGGGIYGWGTIFRYNDTTVKKDVGVSEVRAKSEEVKVFPNPSGGKFTIQTEVLNEPVIEVYNIFGQEIYQTNINANAIDVNLENQPNGVYFYRVVSYGGGLVGDGKIVIEK